MVLSMYILNYILLSYESKCQSKKVTFAVTFVYVFFLVVTNAEDELKHFSCD